MHLFTAYMHLFTAYMHLITVHIGMYVRTYVRSTESQQGRVGICLTIVNQPLKTEVVQLLFKDLDTLIGEGRGGERREGERREGEGRGGKGREGGGKGREGEVNCTHNSNRVTPLT